MLENQVKLDKRDRKLLFQLDLNSRLPLSQLGKKVGLSKQVVDYRLRNLINLKVISEFYTVINFSKLGYTQYKLYFKFQNIDTNKEKEIIEYWVGNKNSIWVAACRGRWDLAVSILAKNVNKLGHILTDFINAYGLFVLEKNILITQTSPVFTKTYLAEQKEKEEFVYGGEIGHYELDEIENKILALLSTNARISVLNLMQKTDLTRDVINYRLKKLEKDNVIVQYRAIIDLSKLGYQLHKIILRLQKLSPEKENELKSFVKQHPEGVQFLKLLGSWDIELEFEVKNEERLHKILLKIRNEFSDVIRDYDTLLIYKEHKLDYFPFKNSAK